MRRPLTSNSTSRVEDLEGVLKMPGEEMIVCVMVSEDSVQCNGTTYTKAELLKDTSAMFWIYLCVYIVLVLFAGLMSGLTMGLLSLDPMSLLVLKRGGKPKEQKYAARILVIVERHHLLLVTLLLANAAAVEAMPIFLEKITNEIVAIIVSVTAVLLFGEIIPQALCTRYGLAIGYYCSPLVLLLMAVFYPIAFPIAMLLDKVLGKEHGTFFRRAELRELVKMHAVHQESNEEPLSYDEVLIVKSALEMRDKTVGDAMTPLESVFMLDISGTINRKTLKEFTRRGHSRVPIYQGSRDNVCGILLVKRLIGLDPDDCTPISTLQGAQTPPPSCLTITPLYDMLNIFQTGKSHLALVYEQKTELSQPELAGIITLEDVIEELIGEEIVDETDLYVDVHRRTMVARARLGYQRQSISEQLCGLKGRITQRPHLHKCLSENVMRSSSREMAEGEALAQKLTVEVQLEDNTEVLSTSVPAEACGRSSSKMLYTIPEGKSLEDSFSSESEGEDTPLFLTIN